MDCNCPALAEIPDIPLFVCGVNIGQIQKIAIQRAGDQFDAAGLPSPSDVLNASSWTTKMSASDDTKITITPMIGGNPIIEPGDAITVGGGDNSTMNGVQRVTGVNPSNFSCDFFSLPSEIEKALKAYRCEVDLVVYFFLKGGKIAARKISTGIYKGFPIQSFFVSDRGNAGFGTDDTVRMSFSLADGYSDDLEVITPTFNPLTDL